MTLHQVSGQLQRSRLVIGMAELLSVALGLHPLLKVDRREVFVVDVAKRV